MNDSLYGSTVLVGLGVLAVVESRSHSDTPLSVGLLWMSEGTVAETSLPDNTQHLQETDIHSPRGIRTHSPRKRGAAGPFFSKTGATLYRMGQKYVHSNTILYTI